MLTRIHAGLFGAGFFHGLRSIAALEVEGADEVIANEQGIFRGELFHLGENDVSVLAIIRCGEVLGIGHVGVSSRCVLGDDGEAGTTGLLVETGGEVEAAVDAGSKVECLRAALFAGLDVEPVFALGACGHKADIDLIVDDDVVLSHVSGDLGGERFWCVRGRAFASGLS